MPPPSRPLALWLSSHPAPGSAVTVLTALLALGAGHRLGTGLLVTAAVAAGQLSIGWSNDLIDAARDRRVARSDKPIARGDLDPAAVRTATVAALGCTVVLSLMCGLASGLVHLVLGVGSGWAYNLGLKRTLWSPAPYALAFGSLPAVVTLALDDPRLPPAWTFAVGALLGVGAHLLNVLPDLADDARTGVRGLPHRLGERRVRLVAPLVLLSGSVLTVLGPGAPTSMWPWLGLAGSALLALVAVTGRGRTPFLAAIGIAFLAVAGLLLRG